MEKQKIINILVKTLKITLASVAAILIADIIGLMYSATAGIVTILSIQNTKRETFKSARNRGLAFIYALIIAAISYEIFGFTLAAFTVYLLIFTFLCLFCGWKEAIAMDSVLITHFWLAQSLAFEIFYNSIMLFVVGTIMGIIANLHLTKKKSEFNLLSAEVDSQIKGIIQRMSLWLMEENKENYTSSCFENLKAAIDKAKTCALTNFNNSIWDSDREEIEYIIMREKQSVVLKEIYRNIKSIDYLPEQAEAVSKLLNDIYGNYHKTNTGEQLNQQLNGLFADMKEQPLPKTREEFEARAILFYILIELKKLLDLKREFMAKNNLSLFKL